MSAVSSDPFGLSERLPLTGTVEPLRCVCGALLAEQVSAPFRVKCRKCGTVAAQ